MTQALDLRVFVAPDSCASGALALDGPAAERVYVRGARAGDTIVALDDSGWEFSVLLSTCTPGACRGRVTGRQLAPERRTKISLYQGLLHPSDFRRLLTGATGLGVVAFVPVITDGSIIPAMGPDGRPEGEDAWPRLVNDAAEASGRGRRPTIGQPMLLGHALDSVQRTGTVLMVDQRGGPVPEAIAERPFSIDLFCPPPSGFSPEEIARASGRQVTLVRAPVSQPDPIQPALVVVETIYALLEGYDGGP